jgi:hypothetical protein
MRGDGVKGRLLHEPRSASVGLADRLPGVLGFLTGIQPHERVPATATVEQREALTERTMQALRDRYGVERGEEIADHAMAAIKALGLSRTVKGLGADCHQDFIEHLAEVWTWRSRDGGA